MQIDRRAFLLSAAGAAACTRARRGEPLTRAVRFLWAQQASDGGFHSTTYGLLRSGQSLTPFVLGALLRVPRSLVAAPPDGVERALEFIRRNTDPGGALGRMDESAADYPNYATALAVKAIVAAQRSGFEAAIAPMVAQLRSQQFNETNGWKREDAPFGGWGMGGQVRRPPEAGHVDLSMTRYVLEALRASGVSASDEVISRALVYLEKSQNSDGGFYFSPVNPEINKAGKVEGHFASYGSATADGLLALRAAGVAETEARVGKAVTWLRAHHRADRVAGFDVEPYHAWGSGLRFYYADAISRALPDLPVDLPPQGEDGSFRNGEKLVKEDDPLIATTFAISVLLPRG